MGFYNFNIKYDLGHTYTYLHNYVSGFMLIQIYIRGTKPLAIALLFGILDRKLFKEINTQLFLV